MWVVGGAYEAYVGRWSRRVADGFVRGLTVPDGLRWLDVGCGTGALTGTVLAGAAPARVLGVDPSIGFVGTAVGGVVDPRVAFAVGDAQALPLPDGAFDVVVSGLALNFVPSADRAVAECVRVAVPGGVVAAYVWDYADGMAMMRHFWDAAVALDPAAEAWDEGARFPLCRPEPLHALWAGAGLVDVAVTAIEIPTVFADFDDYWTPFLGGQGAAPAYAMSLPDEHRDALRDLLRSRVPLSLTARAWAVRGLLPVDPA